MGKGDRGSGNRTNRDTLVQLSEWPGLGVLPEGGWSVGLGGLGLARLGSSGTFAQTEQRGDSSQPRASLIGRWERRSPTVSITNLPIAYQ